jgi:hypothetical protein
MEDVSELSALLRVSDRETLFSLLVGMVDSMPIEGPQRKHLQERLAYLVCGPWRRELHAMVGKILRQGREHALGENAVALDGLIAMMEAVGDLFAAFLGDDGKATSEIVSRTAALRELRHNVGEGSRAARGAIDPAGPRATGIRMVIRRSIDPAVNEDLCEAEAVAGMYYRLQDVIGRDCVMSGKDQSDHPLRVTLLDLITQGDVVFRRIERAFEKPNPRRFGTRPEADILTVVMDSLAPEATMFRAEVASEKLRLGEDFRPARERIARLERDLQETRDAEAERLRSEKVSLRQKIQAEWDRAFVDPVDAILARKAAQEQDREVVGNDWLLLDLRLVPLPAGVRTLVHDAQAGSDTTRTMLVPLIGHGLEWEVRERAFAPVGASHTVFDLHGFIVENRVAIRTARIHDVKVLLIGGTVSREIEDLALSSRLDPHEPVSAEQASANWFRGTVVLCADLVGGNKGVNRASASLLLLPGLLGRQEAARATA